MMSSPLTAAATRRRRIAQAADEPLAGSGLASMAAGLPLARIAGASTEPLLAEQGRAEPRPVRRVIGC